jgi:hypothetical protein
MRHTLNRSSDPTQQVKDTGRGRPPKRPVEELTDDTLAQRKSFTLLTLEKELQAATTRRKRGRPKRLPPATPIAPASRFADPSPTAGPHISDAVDFPWADVNVPRQDGTSSTLSMPVQYVPWADQVSRQDVWNALLEDDTDRATAFARALVDPRYSDIPVSVLAGRYDIRVPDLMEIWRRHQRIAAVGKALERAPDIVADAAEDALSREVCCSRCDGAGMMRVQDSNGVDWRKCVNCKGTGTERKPGDTKSRDFVLRSAGVVDSDRPTTVVNVQMGADSVLDELDRLEQSTVTVTAQPEPQP